ncbi:CvfB family protein [Hugenholtzia roseola]|uniref:CvfB family protein n=1 Tax=Hugenholtzia roseola TaxID=1002 RepID=UPI00041222E1|nr:S1-like domain-containing RNA-binding protein [Hugenholtzia roseola]
MDKKILLGKYNRLEIARLIVHGAILQAQSGEEVLLPKKWTPATAKVGDPLDVFIYTDSEDRLIATTQKPKGILGDLVGLKVVDSTAIGAFLDWGLEKDLFVPKAEQKKSMQKGEYYVVRIGLDFRTNRLIGMGKFEHFLQKTIDEDERDTWQEGKTVSILIYEKTDLGYSAVVENRFWGLLYENEIFSPLQIGERKNAFIKKIRPDGKIDLVLQAQGYRATSERSDEILAKLQAAGGSLPFGDKSSAEEILAHFQMSKRVFKQLIGKLYKEKKIVLTEKGIKLATQ